MYCGQTACISMRREAYHLNDVLPAFAPATPQHTPPLPPNNAQAPRQTNQICRQVLARIPSPVCMHDDPAQEHFTTHAAFEKFSALHTKCFRHITFQKLSVL